MLSRGLRAGGVFAKHYAVFNKRRKGKRLYTKSLTLHFLSKAPGIVCVLSPELNRAKDKMVKRPFPGTACIISEAHHF